MVFCSWPLTKDCVPWSANLLGINKRQQRGKYSIISTLCRNRSVEAEPRLYAHENFSVHQTVLRDSYHPHRNYRNKNVKCGSQRLYEKDFRLTMGSVKLYQIGKVVKKDQTNSNCPYTLSSLSYSHLQESRKGNRLSCFPSASVLSIDTIGMCNSCPYQMSYRLVWGQVGKSWSIETKEWKVLILWYTDDFAFIPFRDQSGFCLDSCLSSKKLRSWMKDSWCLEAPGRLLRGWRPTGKSTALTAEPA